MQGMPLGQLLDWVTTEYQTSQSIFGIPEEKFFRPRLKKGIKIFGQEMAMPVGPAAGPHTQLAQNIAAAYLCGSRFFELKTVQVMDRLSIPKPCIHAQDEGYNTEWSTELSIDDAYAEYVKAWFLLHFLADYLELARSTDFIFNMSVGYDLPGIQTPQVDGFIEGLKNATGREIFQECLAVLRERGSDKGDPGWVKRISPQICQSITLSTMHGCPPAEIEAICRYLLAEKKLHLFVKMNPTLLGYDWVRQTLNQMGYCYIQLKEDSFRHDLGYADGCDMLHRLQKYAGEQGREFGVKLSNTLPVAIRQGELPGEEMYMSGRALYPLTINLALQLAKEFQGLLPISFSGGGDCFNLHEVYATGIRPLTMATTLLKPGGYLRLRQITGELEAKLEKPPEAAIHIERLAKLAADALLDVHHQKSWRPVASRKLKKKLPLLDCFIAPCQEGCPIGQDIPEYIRLVGLGQYAAAYRLIAARNPLPAITGEICDHPCTAKCTRLDYDTPVCIREMKKIAAEKGSSDFLSQAAAVPPANHISVAVIGAGPAGLAAGYFLAGQGFAVTIFDQHQQAGGTVAQIIPDFRISQQAISHDLALIASRGVHFSLGVEPEFSLTKLQAEGFKYICLAIGSGQSQALELTGEQQNILAAIPFLAAYKKDPAAISLGRKVAVIGGGNSAMDAARAAARVPGVEKVTVVYRRSRELMPAHAEEIAAAAEEGIIIRELLQPISLAAGILKCQVMRLGQPEADGRQRPEAEAGHFVDINADTVIAAIGERLADGVLRQNGLAFDPHGHLIHHPETLETSMANVFIGGDALTGPATVVRAIADGRQMAESICAKEGRLWISPLAQSTDADPQRSLSIQRKKGLLQSVLANEAEANRCLECGLLCNICVEVCPNRANIMVKAAAGLQYNQVVHLDALCNQCGNCATFCPYDGAPYRDKLTLYKDESDFSADENSGCYLVQGGDKSRFHVRVDGRRFFCSLLSSEESDHAAGVLIPEQAEPTGKSIEIEPGGQIDQIGQKMISILDALWRDHRYLFAGD